MQKWSAVAIMLATSLGGGAHGALGECEDLIAQIERILTRVKLTPKDAAHVMELRNEGIRLHRAGRYPECMTPLRQAAALLGLKQEPQP
jgi:hypothetical protein